jgi:glycosyltransferase involved in cell wall biosynthesis
LARAGYNVIHVGAGEKATDEITSEGIRLICIPRKRFFTNPYLDILYRRLTFRPGVYRKMLEVCAELRADAYHMHDIQVNRIGYRLQKLPHRPLLVYDVHEDYADQLLCHFPRQGVKRLLAKLYSYRLNRWEAAHAARCDAVIAAVDHIGAKFPQLAGQGKVTMIYNYTTLQPAQLKPYASRSFDAIYAGQISETRGALQIAMAVELARTKVPGIRVMLLGPVPDPKFLKKLTGFITTKGLGEHVLLGGQVPHADIGKYYSESRIGLGIFLPLSIFEYGLQVKTFEYMAYGLPVVCSNFGTLHRIIEESDSGISADPLSPVSISRALVDLLSNRALYDRLSTNAHNAVQQYTWKREEQKLLALYRDTLRLPPNE